MDGEEIPEYPRNFYFKGTGLMLSTYVDDLTLSGPSEHHAPFWYKLLSEVNVEPPETIYRILGRKHVYARFDRVQGEENAALGAAPDALIFDMRDYAQQTIDLPKAVAKVDKIKPAQTPFIPDGAWPKEDKDSPGELAPKACSILMKALWLARLSRPDILKPINDLKPVALQSGFQFASGVLGFLDTTTLAFLLRHPCGGNGCAPSLCCCSQQLACCHPCGGNGCSLNIGQSCLPSLWRQWMCSW